MNNRIVYVSLIGASLMACGGVRNAVRQPLETVGNAYGESAASCKKGGYLEPLAVDWKATERADLEVAMKEGIAVVRYSCDEGVRVMSSCHIGDRYRYVGVSPKPEALDFVTDDEVKVNLPLSHGTVGAALSHEAKLHFSSVLVGKRSASKSKYYTKDLEGDCDGATHFVTAAHVGAFSLNSSGVGHGSANASVAQIGGNAAANASTKLLASDGNPESCKTASGDATEPPSECAALVRVQLAPLAAAPRRQAEKSASTEALPDVCPDGFVLAAGKCARPGADAHRCAPNDPSDCEAQCAKGNAESCYNWASILANGLLDYPADPSRYDDALIRACNLGSGSACEIVLGTDALRKKAKIEPSRLREACESGDGAACAFAAEFAQGAELEKLLTRGCRLGSEGACRDLGEKVEAGSARKILERACTEADSFAACAALKGSAPKGSPAARLASRRVCTATAKSPQLTDSLATACVDAVSLLDEREAAAVIESARRGCNAPVNRRALMEAGAADDTAHGHSCQLLSRLLGRFPKRSVDKGERFAAAKAACLRAGQLGDGGELVASCQEGAAIAPSRADAKPLLAHSACQPDSNKADCQPKVLDAESGIAELRRAVAICDRTPARCSSELSTALSHLAWGLGAEGLVKMSAAQKAEVRGACDRVDPTLPDDAAYDLAHSCAGALSAFLADKETASAAAWQRFCGSTPTYGCFRGPAAVTTAIDKVYAAARRTSRHRDLIWNSAGDAITQAADTEIWGDWASSSKVRTHLQALDPKLRQIIYGQDCAEPAAGLVPWRDDEHRVVCNGYVNAGGKLDDLAVVKGPYYESNRKKR